MKRRVVVISVVALVIIGGIFLRGRFKKETDPGSIVTETVKRSDFAKTVSSSGKTRAAKSVELRFQTSGRLSWVNVKEGDSVKAYQAIAGMDVREVQKNLEKALRDYSSERNDFEETTRVTYPSAPNDTIKRILQKNQWDLDKAVLDVELKHLAVEYATLVTPIAGIVTQVDTPVAGLNITPASATFEIVDPSTMIFEANIDEVDVAGISLGQKALVSLDAIPDRMLEGTVSAIAYSAQTSTGGATVFPVQISLPTGEAIRVGFNGDVTIMTQTSPDALVVPISALRGDGPEKFVYRKQGKKYEKVSVGTSLATDDEVIITSGLAQGDEVVTKGFISLPK